MKYSIVMNSLLLSKIKVRDKKRPLILISNSLLLFIDRNNIRKRIIGNINLRIVLIVNRSIFTTISTSSDRSVLTLEKENLQLAFSYCLNII